MAPPRAPNRRGRGLLAFLACVLLAAPLAADPLFLPGLGDPGRRPEKPDLGAIRAIRFVTDDDYPPFHFALADGSLAGFNVDLARALCEELTLVCTIQRRRWDTIVNALLDGEADAAVASLAISPAARARIDFTMPYYRTPARFVARKGAPPREATPEALRDAEVGVEAHGAHAAFLETYFPKTRRRPYDSAAALRAALRGGEIDLAFGDGIGFSLWLAGEDSQGCCAFAGGPFLDERFFGEGAGIALRKENPTLRRALNYALQRLSERGVYAELYLKYFPVGFY